MSQSKLYSALLKTQSQRELWRESGYGPESGERQTPQPDQQQRPNVSEPRSPEPVRPESRGQHSPDMRGPQEPGELRDSREAWERLSPEAKGQYDAGPEGFYRPTPETQPEPDSRPHAPSMDGMTAYDVPETHSPTLYDSSLSLDLINNPRPWTYAELKARKIIYPSMSNKDILNAYREVRIKLRNLSGNNNFSVMVSSLSKKTDVQENILLPSFNLAASFALDAHSSALLVDCNPYSTDLQKLVSMKMTYGVTDFLDDPTLHVNDIIYPSGIDRLSVVPAGNIDVSAVELFSSVRMKTLMDELTGRYPDRYIVINAPPFRISTEARILVRFANHAVMTVPFGEITPDEVLEAIETLGTNKFAGVMYQE